MKTYQKDLEKIIKFLVWISNKGIEIRLIGSLYYLGIISFLISVWNENFEVNIATPFSDFCNFFYYYEGYAYIALSNVPFTLVNCFLCAHLKRHNSSFNG